jgi:alkanesulfonate monooxygenase SsuD/methylene tetrahydromethanopterin reductase-like flavin-dependent oxidoreductase (luciferase family)
MALPSTAPALAQALEDVRARVRRAAERAKKNPNEIDILAVTKTLPPERVWEAWELGLWQFGESRVQEAERKKNALRDRFPRKSPPPLASDRPFPNRTKPEKPWKFLIAFSPWTA